MAIENSIYTAHATVTGGRIGKAITDGGQLNLVLDRPKEMGGKAEGTNPEQLFAAGYGACLLSALKIVAGKQHMRVPENASIDSDVSIGPLAGGTEGFGIAVAMRDHLPGLDRNAAEALVEAAHHVCPYSNAT